MQPKYLTLAIAVVIAAVCATFVAGAAQATASLPATQICDPMSVAYDVNDAGTVAGYTGSWPDVRAATCSSANVLKYLDLPDDATGSIALAINGSGQVAGQINLPSGSEAVVWDSSGAITRLGYLPGGTFSGAQDINDAGWVAGVASAGGGNQGFVWKGAGSIQALTLPSGMTSAVAQGIDNDGQIVGNASAMYVQPVAVLWDADGVPTALTPLAAGAGASAGDLNGFDEIVGNSQPTAPSGSDPGREAVVWDDGVPTDLGPGGGRFGLAAAINASGQVVGYMYDEANESQAFLWDDGVMTALDPLSGDTQAFALGINGTGKIVGISQSSSGVGRAVIWSVAGDTTAPEFSVSVSPNKLWPPSHQYVTVTAAVTASDDTDPNPTIELVSVTSNEPDNGVNDGNTTNDIVIKPASAHSYADTFQLRAERDGLGKGRIYTITYRAIDASNNSATKSATVTVPLAK